MVSNSRTPPRADSLRSLNTPRLITVRGTRRDGAPTFLVEHHRPIRVAEVHDTWLIEDEWWRTPIQRQYFQLLLANGTIRTIYHDLVTDEWYDQAY